MRNGCRAPGRPAWRSPRRAAAASPRPASSPASPSRRGRARPGWRPWASTGTSSGASRSRPSRRTPGFVVPTAEPPKGAPRCRGSVSLEDARLGGEGDAGSQAEVLLRLEVAPGEGADPVADTVRSAETVGPGESTGSAFRRAIQSRRRRGRRAGSRSRSPRRGSRTRRSSATSSRPTRGSGTSRWASSPTGRTRPRFPGSWRVSRTPIRTIADRAVGALAQIGDPRAVGPIVELSRRREGPFVAQMVRAVGDIGGPEAEAYLETMAVRPPGSRSSPRPPGRRSGTPGDGAPPARWRAGRGEPRVRGPL